MNFEKVIKIFLLFGEYLDRLADLCPVQRGNLGFCGLSISNLFDFQFGAVRVTSVIS